MYWIILRIVSKLAGRAARFRKQASHPDSPGGTTIVRDEWLAFIPEIIEVFAESLGVGSNEAASLFMEGSAGMLDTGAEEPYKKSGF